MFSADGLILAGNVHILIWNCIGAAVIIGWYAVTSIILFYGLKKFGLFRIAAKLEKSGLDVPYHQEPAYILYSRKGRFMIFHIEGYSNKQQIFKIVFWSITGSLNVEDQDFLTKTQLTNIKYLDEALSSGKNVVIGKRAVPNGVKVDVTPVAPVVSHM